MNGYWMGSFQVDGPFVFEDEFPVIYQGWRFSRHTWIEAASGRSQAAFLCTKSSILDFVSGRACRIIGRKSTFERGDMASSAYTTNAGTALNAGEIGQIASLLHVYGRVTLLVPSYAEGEVCRRNLADAGVGTGVDVVTPKAWIAGLWEQFGDGSQLASTSQRRLLMAQVLADADADEEASTSSLKNNPGSVNMLAEMARECYPYVVSESSGQTKLSRAEQRSIEMLKRYGALLDGHSLIEPSAAAEVLGTQFSVRCPACARAVAVRGVTELSEHLLRLLEVVAQNGSLDRKSVV